MRYEIREVDKKNGCYAVLFSSGSLDLISEELKKYKTNYIEHSFSLRVFDRFKGVYISLWQ